MRHLWVVVALCAACKETKHVDQESITPEVVPPTPAPLPAPVPTQPKRDITSPLPEKGPHPDYPTAAAAGTDKLFFLEEPDRGPKAPASYTPPPRTSVTWTTAAYCEYDQLGMACSRGAPTGETSWRLGRGAGVTIAEQLYGDRVHQTIVFLSADARPTQRLHIDESGQLDEALLFTTPGRFSGRHRDGGNALPGCGMLAYEQDKQHHLSELRCLQWLGEPMRDTSAVAMRRFTSDARGFTTEETRFGLDGKPVNGLDGVHRVVHVRNAAGRMTLAQYFDTEGKRAIDIDGCSGERDEWTATGMPARSSCLDRSDTPVKNTDGVTTKEYTYNARSCIARIRYLDAAGAVSKNHLDLHGYDYETDDRCLDLSKTCIGVQGTPVACGPGKPAKEVYTREARGYITSARHFAADGTPTGDRHYRVHELRYTHDASGHPTESACFDDGGAPVGCGSTGFHAKVTSFDDAGRITTQTFLDERRQPTTNMSVPQRRFRYDNYDHEYEARDVDADGKLIDSSGSTIRHNLWDATHHLFGIQLLDAQEKPAHFRGCYTGSTCPSTAWHAVRINRRVNGMVVSNQFFDADGQLIATIDCRSKPCFDGD